MREAQSALAVGQGDGCFKPERAVEVLAHEVERAAGGPTVVLAEFDVGVCREGGALHRVFEGSKGRAVC